MLKVQEIKELIRAMDQSSLDEMKFEQEGTKIILKKQTAEAVAVQAAPAPVAAAAPQQEAQAPKPVEQAETVKAESPSKDEKSEAADANLHTITSPMVGTFYSSPSPDSDPYVKSGDTVEEESVVCIVEAMKLMNEIEAEVKGKIVEVLAQNGELVEYGQPLFVVEPS
ncbi:acetyl-CoA carboxylase biotin carboxyl carrier protein [Alkalihalophilus pseudofirmus]|uniref:acetyl-CoA carboxylase biotin carboxyl carrier protein n=1 Tax=Alkalihalophilus pseudofirmus TaxID=79885 RepID=UPI00259B95EF|nr:acetyl-CoA carboxylase biotin carboxyl carrier protein [Alkalihalophilus pseudofirmus]WEG15876.1 acetyl-CoA carboxylase biotin carboxyl carrier protein [Alkalihalophilus pseudofirmus]